MFVCLFFETGFLCVAWPSRNSLCRPGQPQTQKSACLCLPSARIKGMLHHCPARENFIVWDFQVFCGTTSSTAHHATYYIHSLTSGQKKKCTSLLLKRELWGFIFLVTLELIFDHKVLLLSTEKIYFMDVSSS